MFVRQLGIVYILSQLCNLAVAQTTSVTTQFALDLYSELATQDSGNLFFSPLSISTALTMAWAGAEGETAKEMSDVLHLWEPTNSVHDTYHNLLTLLNSTSASDTAITLSIANALWVEKSLSLRRGYRNIVADDYLALVESVDFRGSPEIAVDSINNWVSENTRGRIDKIVSRHNVDPLTSAVLTNTVYFHGLWKFPFQVINTRLDTFFLSVNEIENTSMMSFTGVRSLSYLETDEYQALALPFGKGNWSMFVMLPKERNGLPSLESKLKAGLLAEAVSSIQPFNAHYDLRIPKFKMSHALDLEEILKHLGMKQAFAGNANFSGMSEDPLFISHVVHKAFIDVSESGAEAAAATAVIMPSRKNADPKEPKIVFHADHPFLFLIRDNQTGEILFIGRMVNPPETES